jgi:hypothetical protein
MVGGFLLLMVQRMVDSMPFSLHCYKWLVYSWMLGMFFRLETSADCMYIINPQNREIFNNVCKERELFFLCTDLQSKKKFSLNYLKYFKKEEQ